MKAIIPALCGALLLATSLPAAAQPIKVNDFGMAKQRGIGAGTVQADDFGRQRQLPGSAMIKVGRTPETRSTIQAGPNARGSFALPRTGRTTTGEVLDWTGKHGPAGTVPRLNH